MLTEILTERERGSRRAKDSQEKPRKDKFTDIIVGECTFDAFSTINCCQFSLVHSLVRASIAVSKCMFFFCFFPFLNALLPRSTCIGWIQKISYVCIKWTNRVNE